MNPERIPLVHREAHSGLTIFFATLCIVDIFGVFPIIALPRAIVQCGLLGIPLVIVVVFFQIYTAALLGECWVIAASLDPQILRKNRNPLAAVTEMTLGPRARTWINILLDLTIFGCGIPNLLVASQNLQLFGLKVSENQFDLSFCYWLLVVGVLLCPLMWLGSPRDMKSLAICSTFAVCLTAILVWWCILLDDRTLDADPVPTSPTWDKFISGYGMLAFQFDVHPTLMTVQVDMKQPKDINKAVVLSFLFSGALFGITTSLAVWKYGGSTTANILQIAPAGGVSRAAILVSAIQLIFSSVIGHAAMFLHLEDELHVRRTFGWKRCAMRSAVVFLGVAVGESVPRFDIVMSLIGGSLTGPLVFVLPPIMYARARALKAQSRGSPQAREVVSPAQRLKGDVPLVDPKIHSQSTYYGFKDEKNQQRYSYVYFDNEDDDEDLLSDVDADDDGEGVQMVEKNVEITPVIVDPTKPGRLRRKAVVRPSDIEIDSKIRGNAHLERLINCLGYLVVVIGILITISSTYINIKNTIRFVNFTPPCIINAAAAGNASNAGGG
ncbi:amino acid transporter AVT1C [Diachasma alloeum]|uniref:amino acid transporter AVT1C n=1 Tax=Diachasma alloeum TaxID=454923 RepID=UPI000738480F|nr:amino acid transporter AVT1C [Diachasma alloeum]